MKRLLVVDDEPHMARVLTVALGVQGWRVDTALSGEEALERITTHPPDALITDISMPGMSGRDLCEAIRSLIPDATFPIFIMSSLNDQKDRDWVGALGGIEILEKPLSPRYVAARLARRCGLATAA